MSGLMVRVPHRVSISGGSTDFPDYFREHGGVVVSAAFKKYIYVMVNETVEHQGYEIHNNGEHEFSLNVNDIKNDIVRAVLDRYGCPPGTKITINSELPQGCGLASSSALTVALIMAMSKIRGLSFTQYELSLEAIHIESDVCKRQTGWQDQFGVTYPGVKKIVFGMNKEYDLPYAYVETIFKPNVHFASNMFLVYTGKTRDSVKLLAKQKENIQANIERLDKIKSLTDETVDQLKAQYTNWDVVGRNLSINWNLKKELADGINNTNVDNLYSKGIAAGASGGKLMGAGSGGFLLFVVPPMYQMEFVQLMNGYAKMPVIVDSEGPKLWEL